MSSKGGLKSRLQRNLGLVPYYGVSRKASSTSAFHQDDAGAGGSGRWITADRMADVHDAFGPLEKMTAGAIVQQWKLRYFTLQEGKLGYAKDRAETQLSKWVDLLDCKLPISAPVGRVITIQRLDSSATGKYGVQFDEVGAKVKRLSAHDIEEIVDGVPVAVGSNKAKRKSLTPGTRVMAKQDKRKSGLVGKESTRNPGTIVHLESERPMVITLRAKNDATAQDWVQKMNESAIRAREHRNALEGGKKAKEVGAAKKPSSNFSSSHTPHDAATVQAQAVYRIHMQNYAAQQEQAKATAAAHAQAAAAMATAAAHGYNPHAAAAAVAAASPPAYGTSPLAAPSFPPPPPAYGASPLGIGGGAPALGLAGGAQAHVSGDALTAHMAQLGLLEFLPALRSPAVGVETVADLKLLDEGMLVKAGMNPIQVRRCMQAVPR
eukprot:g7797.t1